ncbi:MAG TPA: isoprenylcysteine carboxylmethyltransferase family protein [Chryseosolibacter sp.]
MVSIGNFFFKYRNLLFPIFGISIFIPSPSLFTPDVFGPNYYAWPVTLGFLIAIIGQAFRAMTIGFKYIVRGGKDKKVYAVDLVTEGMFHHCRNPLYVGNILMLLGVGLLSNSLYFVITVVPIFCFIYQAIVVAEENYLRGKFGPQYDHYTRDVNRWIPNLTGIRLTFRGAIFNWRRYLLNEYNTLYMLGLSMLLVLMVHHPQLRSMAVNEKLIVSGIVVAILTALFLFVRHLKKTNRLSRTLGSL